MDELDSRILSLIQDDFPLTPRPYAEIGRRVGCSEEEAFQRILTMKRAGVIRRIGGSFDSRRLGYVTTLVGMRVAEKDIERAAAFVSSFPEVTHNYQREDRTAGVPPESSAESYALWLTLVCNSQHRLEEIIRELEKNFPDAELLELPAKRIFKLKVRFDPSEP